MAKILAAGTAVTWTPPGQTGLAAPITYELAVPTVRSRLAYRRRVAELGGRQVGDREVVERIAAVLRGLEVEGADAELRDRHLATVEGLLAEYDAMRARLQAGAFDGEAGGQALVDELGQRRPLEREVDAVGRELAEVDPDLAGLYAARATYADAAGLAAAQIFLAGWSGIETPFRRLGGQVPDEVLLAMPEWHLGLLAQHVETLFAPTEAEAKNSDSLSSSPSEGSTSTTTDQPHQTAP